MHLFLEGQHVRQEELVLLFRAEEAILDEHEHNFSDGGEVALTNLEEARVEGSHDIVIKDLDIAWLEQSNVLDELGKLGELELSDVDLFAAEPFERLVQK